MVRGSQVPKDEVRGWVSSFDTDAALAGGASHYSLAVGDNDSTHSKTTEDEA
jgi:hypothetical protein